MTAFAALLLSAWAAWRAIRDRPVILRQLIASGLVEAFLLGTAVAAGVTQARGNLPGDPLVLWGYLLTALFILPVAGVGRSRTAPARRASRWWSPASQSGHL